MPVNTSMTGGDITVNDIHSWQKMLHEITAILFKLKLAKKEAKSEAEQNKIFLQGLSDIIKDGNSQTKIFDMTKADKIYEPLKDKIEKYNLKNPTETIKVFEFDSLTKENKPQRAMLASSADMEKINSLIRQIQVERGGLASEIPVKEFVDGMIGKQGVRIKNVDATTAELIQNKHWNNDFYYAATKSGDGNINLAVSQYSFMNAITSPSKEDLFTTILRQKATITDTDIKIREYDNKMEQLVMSYDGDSPIFIIDANAGDRFIELNKDGFVVYRTGQNIGEVELLELKKMSLAPDKSNLLEYQKELYKQFDSFNSPVQVTPELASKLGKFNKERASINQIRNVCKYKCQSGYILKEEETGRPMRTFKDIKARNRADRITKAYGNILEKVLIAANKEANFKRYILLLDKINVSDEAKELVTKSFNIETRESNKQFFMSKSDMDRAFELSVKKAPVSEEDRKELDKIIKDIPDVKYINILNDKPNYERAVHKVRGIFKKKYDDYCRAPKEEKTQYYNEPVSVILNYCDNDINNIEFDTLEKAALETLALEIEVDTVKDAEPFIEGEDRRTEAYKELKVHDNDKKFDDVDWDK